MKHRFNFDEKKVEAVLDHINYIFEIQKLTFAEKKFVLVWLDIDNTYDVGAKAIDNTFKNAFHVDLMELMNREKEPKQEEKPKDGIYA